VNASQAQCHQQRSRGRRRVLLPLSVLRTRPSMEPVLCGERVAAEEEVEPASSVVRRTTRRRVRVGSTVDQSVLAGLVGLDAKRRPSLGRERSVFSGKGSKRRGLPNPSGSGQQRHLTNEFKDPRQAEGELRRRGSAMKVGRPAVDIEGTRVRISA